jgi:ribosomal protein L11 methyltransferase
MEHWLGVILLIPEGVEEAVSNFLFEQGATGMEEVDEALGWKRLKAYFPQDGKEKKVLRGLGRYLKSLQSIFPEMSGTRIETISIPNQDWSQNWKRFFKPVQVTPKFVVKPPWSKIRLKKNKIAIDIYPGMAFGTGTHATTKLCMRALERSFRKRGISVLDVGTGSGILSIAAAQLGAGEVWGLDIDGEAVSNARENVKRNLVSDIVKIRKGRVGKIQKRFDLVVANIDYKSLRRMRWPLIHHLKSKGILILSGILKEMEEKVRQYYMDTGLLKSIRTDQEREWVCLNFKKSMDRNAKCQNSKFK